MQPNIVSNRSPHPAYTHIMQHTCCTTNLHLMKTTAVYLMVKSALPHTYVIIMAVTSHTPLNQSGSLLCVLATGFRQTPCGLRGCCNISCCHSEYTEGLCLHQFDVFTHGAKFEHASGELCFFGFIVFKSIFNYFGQNGNNLFGRLKQSLILL